MIVHVDQAPPRFKRLSVRREVRTPEARLRLMTRLLTPAGTVLDVTARMVEGAVASITENTEEDFLELAHGDLDLSLNNDDGLFDRLFSNVDPDDQWELILDRQSAVGERLRWERLFGGVLDLPWSLTFDRDGRTCSFQVFSYSKLLERASAEGVRRSVTGLTGNVTLGSQLVTVSSSTNLRVGDDIQFSTVTVTETQRITRINSATQVRTAATWANTFAAGTPLTVVTPYHRNKSPLFLAQELLAAAGVSFGGYNVEQELASYPIGVPMSDDQFPTTTTGDFAAYEMLGIKDGKITMWFENSVTGDRQMDNPRGTWVTLADENRKHDWTIYRDTEPAGVNQAGGKVTFYAPDYATGLEWQVFVDGGTNLWKLYRSDSGIPVATLTINGNTVDVNVEFPPEDGKPWTSQVGSTGDAQNNTRYWDGAALQTIEASIGGWMRYLRRLKVVALHERNSASAGPGAWTTNLHIYDAVSRKRLRTVQVPVGFHAQSLRVFDKFIAGLYFLGPTMRLIIWDLDWLQLADYEISSTGDSNVPVDEPTLSYMSVFTETSGREVLIGVTVGNVLFCVAKYYAGVVPYADFDGLSVAAAMRELAMITNSYVHVDEFRFGRLLGRANDVLMQRGVIELDVGLTLTEWPIYEFYRTSAEVSGRDQDGNEITVIVGDTGDSAHRISVTGQLVTTGGLANAVGNQFVAFLSVKRAQAEIEAAETGKLIHVFDRIRHDGREWIGIEETFNPEQRRYRLRLIEKR